MERTSRFRGRRLELLRQEQQQMRQNHHLRLENSKSRNDSEEQEYIENNNLNQDIERQIESSEIRGFDVANETSNDIKQILSPPTGVSDSEQQLQTRIGSKNDQMDITDQLETATNLESISSNRITILNEPLKNDTKNMIYSNGRETVLPIQSRTEFGSFPPWTKNIDRKIEDKYRFEGEDESNILFILGPIIVFLIGFILYNLCNRESRREILRNWSTSFIQPSYRNKKQLRKRSSGLLEPDIGMMGQNFGCAGECVQLVDRNPHSSQISRASSLPKRRQGMNGGEEKIDIIPVTVAHDGEALDKVNSSGKDEKTNSLVIIKRKFTKNSFVLAAKSSTKPKVKLLTDRLRKFIDDEAEELQRKEAQDGCKSLKDRIVGGMFATFSLRHNVPSTSEDLRREGEQKQEGKQVEDGDDQPQAYDIIPQTIEAQVHHANDDSNFETRVVQNNHKEISSSCQTNGEIFRPLAQNLSSSPVINEACSSISGCSMFSASPIDQQVSTCGCDLNHRDGQVSEIQGSNLRSRSQGHSPSQYDRAIQIYRPCYSASPSNLSDGRGVNKNCCNQQLVASTKPHYSNNFAFTSRPCQHLDTTTCTISQPSSTLPTVLNKCNSNHIKRQYENYYDEERDDAYRRLTASIGMEFGIGFEPDGRTVTNTVETIQYPSQHKGFAEGRARCIDYQQPQADSSNMFALSSRPFLESYVDNQRETYCKCCHRGVTGNMLDGSIVDSESLLRNSHLQNIEGIETSMTRKIDSEFATGTNSNYLTATYENGLSDSRKLYQSDLTPIPLTSILVQQPSVSTPSPTGDYDAKSNTLQPAPSKNSTDRNNIQDPNCYSEEKSKITHRRCSSSFVRSNNRSKLKCNRRFSQNHTTTEANHNPLCPRISRRMSVAGSQVYNSSLSNGTQPSPSRVNGSSLLEHRASIASDESGWIQQHQQNIYNLPGRINIARTNPIQDQNQILRSQRPSDASLYESHYYTMFQNGKSNCSSSGGSSSGIGVSGSACTNTPTGTLPFMGFPTGRGEALLDFSCATGHQQQQFNPHVFNQHEIEPVVTSMNSVCRSSAYQNRKYSLPVQLESQSSERISPNHRNRLLFEKNLQPVDSSTTVLQQRLTDSSTNRQHNLQGCRPSVESRRSSQTITRQSSFWLEDNSVDSILSLTTSGLADHLSEDGSQIDVNQLASTELDCNLIPDVSMQHQPPASPSTSQRPSISSAILSGDSIDSVKQQPVRGAINVSQQDRQEVSMDDSVHTESVFENKPKDADKTPQGASDDKHKVNLRHGGNFKSRLSKRILALASKSSGISKRHLFGRIRSRRYPRLNTTRTGSSSSSSGDMRPAKNLSTKHQNSAPASIGYKLHKDESDEDPKEKNYSNSTLSQEPSQSEENEQDVDCAFMNPPNERMVSDHNSASLERQCRDLWKLRATLHDNTEVSDDWSNYHQRLNRRYDSGYKSIENQLSSSIEGNILIAASQRTPSPSTTLIPQETTDETVSLLTRPQSGCSGSVVKKSDEEKHRGFSNSPTCEKFLKEVDSFEEELLEDTGRVDIIESKLSDLDIESTGLDCLHLDRDCNSRNSGSSNEGESKQQI